MWLGDEGRFMVLTLHKIDVWFYVGKGTKAIKVG